MSFSYSGDPSSSNRDAVRFTIGDTSSSDQQFSNEEIDYILSGQPSVTLASIELCTGLIGHYARLVTQSVGAVSVQYQERMQNYEQLLSRLRRRLAAPVYAGGISVSDKAAQLEDDDYDQPTFKRGMDDRKG